VIITKFYALIFNYQTLVPKCEASYGHFGTKEDTSARATLDQAMARWTAMLANYVN